MTDRYQPLRDAIAAGPTKGPWEARAVDGLVAIAHPGGWVMETDEAQDLKDAAYIAAADPSTIAALLEDHDREKSRADSLADQVQHNYAQIADLLAERNHLHEECHEQARLLGMSGSREAKLLAERDALQDEVRRLKSEPFSGEGRHPMSAERRGEWIVIAVSTEALKCAAEGHPGLEWHSDEGEFAAPIIVDLDTFVDEFVSALNSEKEDGSTVITEAFDKAIINAIEGGAVGIEIEAEAAKIRAALADGEDA